MTAGHGGYTMPEFIRNRSATAFQRRICPPLDNIGSRRSDSDLCGPSAGMTRVLSGVPGRICHVPLQLTIPGDIFTAIGLLLDAVGVVFLFWYAPEKIPDPQSTVSFAIEGDARIRWRKD